jgi:hypothetical protein
VKNPKHNPETVGTRHVLVLTAHRREKVLTLASKQRCGNCWTKFHLRG